jgi:hypothetical protein
MQTDKTTQTQLSNDGVWKGHYHSMTEALTVAMQLCWVWRKGVTRQPVTVKDMYNYALRYDKQHPLHSPQFFMVTREGAIGFSEGYEYQTRFLFIPMEAGPERDKLIADMRWALKAEHDSNLAVEKAVREMMAAKEKK